MRDALRGIGHRIHGIQRAASQEPSQQAANHQHHGEQGEVVPGEVADDFVVVIYGAADRQIIFVAVMIHPQSGTDHVGDAAGVAADANGRLSGLKNVANLGRRVDADGIVNIGMLQRVALGIGQHVDALHAPDGETFVGIVLVVEPIRPFRTGAKIALGRAPFLVQHAFHLVLKGAAQDLAEQDAEQHQQHGEE